MRLVWLTLDNDRGSVLVNPEHITSVVEGDPGEFCFINVRGREKPYVATPLGWDEIEAGAEDPDALEQFRFDQVLQRVEDYGDLFE